MGDVLESDPVFYAVVGLFTIAVFVVSIAVFALSDSASIGGRELVGLIVGFVLFMAVFFVSIVVTRLEDGEDVR